MDTEVYSVFGRRGCGKTVLSKRIQVRYPRRVIFDSLGEYSSSEGVIVRSFNQFAEEIKRVHRLPSFVIIVQFNPESVSFRDEFHHCLRIIFHVGDLQVVIEEVQRFASVHRMDHWLEQCFLVGRHKGISLLCVTQRPGLCNKTIISQSGHVYFGQLHEMNDLEYCRSVLWDEAFRLPALASRKFLYFSPGRPIKLINNDKV